MRKYVGLGDGYTGPRRGPLRLPGEGSRPGEEEPQAAGRGGLRGAGRDRFRVGPPSSAAEDLTGDAGAVADGFRVASSRPDLGRDLGFGEGVPSSDCTVLTANVSRSLPAHRVHAAFRAGRFHGGPSWLSGLHRLTVVNP